MNEVIRDLIRAIFETQSLKKVVGWMRGGGAPLSY